MLKLHYVCITRLAKSGNSEQWPNANFSESARISQKRGTDKDGEGWGGVVVEVVGGRQGFWNSFRTSIEFKFFQDNSSQ